MGVVVRVEVVSIIGEGGSHDGVRWGVMVRDEVVVMMSGDMGHGDG